MSYSHPLANYLVIVSPLITAVFLAFQKDYGRAVKINVFSSAVGFFLATILLFSPHGSDSFVFTDDFNIIFVMITALMGLTTSIYSVKYIEHEMVVGRLSSPNVRFYHTTFQIMIFAMNLAFLASNIGLMWVAIEIATLSTVLMVGLYRTNESLEAAWKYFILGSVGIALALFGTILIYTAAEPIIGEGYNSMVWQSLMKSAALFNPRLLNVAFVFIILGYGTKVGLVPLHAWLPDAHAEGPTPISAVLSGLLLNVALYAVLRFKMLLAVNLDAIAPGPIMILFGLVSIIFASLMLYRRDDVKRLFAFSSIEHMGLMVFAFGIGGPAANFGGLLHMIMHSVTKSAIFFSVGHIAQIKGTQRIDQIRGITTSQPMLGWGLVAGTVAIIGLPPFGLFTSEFIILTSAYARHPLLALMGSVGLLLAFGAILLRVTHMAFGEPTANITSIKTSQVPLLLHLLIALVAGLYLPPHLVSWFQNIAHQLG